MPQPRTSDGKPIFLPNLFPGNVFLYLAGAGDDRVAGRGVGTEFCLSSSTQGETQLEFQFNDWVYLAGGNMCWINAQFGDWVTFETVAPATPVTPNGSSAGNCNVVNGVIVPAAGDGAFDVDLEAAVPVPAFDDEVAPSGYWDWTEPNTGLGVVTASATPGAALWHLIATEVVLVRFANRVHLLGDDNYSLTVPAIKPKKILPQWKGRVTLHNHSGHADLQGAWYIVLARTTTV